MGAPKEGGALAGLDLAVRGTGYQFPAMRVGGRRSVVVPPELGFGAKQRGEVPPNSEITIDVEVLSLVKKGDVGK